MCFANVICCCCNDVLSSSLKKKKCHQFVPALSKCIVRDECPKRIPSNQPLYLPKTFPLAAIVSCSSTSSTTSLNNVLLLQKSSKFNLDFKMLSIGDTIPMDRKGTDPILSIGPKHLHLNECSLCAGNNNGACPCCVASPTQSNLAANWKAFRSDSSISTLDTQSDDSGTSVADDDNYSNSASNTNKQGHICEGTVISVVAEGWLYKKGSGNDLIGSKSFKPRWARLVFLNLFPVEGRPDHEGTVPVLQVYWHQYASLPSSSIRLDGASFQTIDKPTSKSWNPYRFEIVGACGKVLRTFSASKEERDQWVNALNVVKASYEAQVLKAKTEQERQRRKAELPPTPRSMRKPAQIKLRTFSPPRKPT